MPVQPIGDEKGNRLQRKGIADERADVAKLIEAFIQLFRLYYRLDSAGWAFQHIVQ